MSKFIRSKYLHNLQNENQTKVSATELLLIDVNDKKYFKSLESPDIGIKANNMFAASDVLDMCEEEKEFRQNCLSSYINWSHTHPLNRNETNAMGGISNLTLLVSNALSSEGVCDKVRSEWKLYLIEIIPEDASLNEEVVSPIKTRPKVSYWEKAFVIAGVTEVGNIDEAKSCGIEKNFLYLEKDCTSMAVK